MSHLNTCCVVPLQYGCVLCVKGIAVKHIYIYIYTQLISYISKQRLWLLLVPEKAEEVIAELLSLESLPDCLVDEFTRRFREMFSSPEALRSWKCRGVLVMLGRLLRLDITRIECRHAMLRTLVRKSVTWKPILAEVSAHFLLSRHRIQATHRNDLLKEMFAQFGFVDGRTSARNKRRVASSKKPAPKRKCKQKKYKVSTDGSCTIAVPKPKRRDGGGAYRAALRMQLEGKQFGSEAASRDAFRQAVRQYKQWKNADTPEYRRCVEIGRAARAACKRGLPAFGRTRLSISSRKSHRQHKVLKHIVGGSAAASAEQNDVIADNSLLPRELKPLYEFVCKEDVLRSLQKHTECQSQQDADMIGMFGHSGRVCAPSSFDIGECQWSCPVQPLLEKLVAVLDQDSQTKSTHMNRLVNLWKAKHLGIAHESAAPMPSGVDDGPPPQQCRSIRGRSVCSEAGFCTCIGSRPYVPLPRAFAGALRQWIGKDKAANTEFLQGLLVAHVFAEGAQVEHWLHLGMGNLNSDRFTLMHLQPSAIWMQQCAQRRRCDAVALECPADVWPVSFFSLNSLSEELVWFIELYQVDVHEPSDLPVTFCASQFLVHPFPEPLKDLMWRPFDGARPDSKRLAIRYAGDVERRRLADRMHKAQSIQGSLKHPPLVEDGHPPRVDEEDGNGPPLDDDDEDNDAWGISDDEEEDPDAAAGSGAAAPRYNMSKTNCVLC